MKGLLQALDTDSRLDLLPTIWKGEFQDAVTVPLQESPSEGQSEIVGHSG